MTYIVAVDQSTSATKAVLFDTQGQAVDKASCGHEQIYPQPGWTEHNAEEIWQNVLTVLHELLHRNSDRVASVVGLSITNQRETFVVFDRQTGTPLSRAIVWQCRRGDAVCRALADKGHIQTIREKTGLKLDTYFSGSKLKWLVDERPDIGARLRDGTALFGTIDTYLIYRLTRGRVYATDHTNASRTLLFDIHRLRWDESLCELFGISSRMLPEVKESFAHFGETDAGGAFPNAIPVCAVIGDSQASLFAQRCFGAGTAKATFGTGTSVLLNIGHEPQPASENVVSALAWVWRNQPVYAFEGLINYSSATIAWLKNQLGLLDDTAESETLATAVEDNGGVYLVPAFAGLSSPYWSTDARAAIVGMSAHSRREHIVRAALEAIAYQIRDVLESMRECTGVSPHVLFADGGPTGNHFLMRFTADITGLELVVSDIAESSALGAAMAGMLGLGIMDALNGLAALPRKTQVYRPSMDPVAVNLLYDGWKTAVRRVL